MSLIEVEQLRKTFARPIKHEGRFAAIKGLIDRRQRLIPAVEDVSFHIETGEMVGYLGPNGAGKSTTIKMLTGILVPTSGRIEVGGLVPHRQRVAHVRRIGVVFGQRTQLWWDLPTLDSFELLRHIYRIPQARYRTRLEECIALLDMEPFLATPVRQLSLGQRMRADLAAALLHEPQILFLDEPTIGLDVVARERIRTFLQHINQEQAVTVILTTHDLGDISRLCRRVILIDHGRVIFDGELEQLRARFGRWRTLVVDFSQEVAAITVAGAELVRREGPRAWLRFDRERTTAAALIADIAAAYPLRDLTVEEPEIEGVVRDIYSGGLNN
jgi:ABC-2 type transport system ATP-binding protein